MSDRVAVFSNGKVEQIGSPLEVYNRPLNRFVAEFIGDSNFFAGRVDPSRPGWVELSGIGPVRIATRAISPAGEVELMSLVLKFCLSTPLTQSLIARSFGSRT